MSYINFVDASGRERKVEAKPGLSIMENAINNDIEPIIAECGGSCACATCHVVILDEKFIEILGPPDDDERDMLTLKEDATNGSRLSCQIPFTEELDGIRILIPITQYTLKVS